MANDYIKAREMAERWGVTPRRINQLCAQNYIPGVYKEGRFWMIPEDAARPSVVREKNLLDEYSANSLENSLKYRDEGYGQTGRNNKNGKRLPCPVGITSFREVSTECYYVDKTLMIRDVIDDHNKVYLFTRPRRFGKTLTVDMIRTYFEKTQEDTSVYFANKQIWTAGSRYRNFQGKFPVIFLSFKDTHYGEWEELYGSLCFSIREEYLRHIELLTSDRLNEYDRKYYQKVVDSEASTTEMQFALRELSSMLAKHYCQKVIVIIDEYDTPVEQGYIGGCYDKVTRFMRNMLSPALKDNADLQFGVLTGILRIAKEGLLSGLNNLSVNTILDEKYSGYFGFTEQETEEMAAYYGMSDRMPEIREWYDGYMFGSAEMYNPWSVISYFNNDGVPKAFWSRTSGNDLIRRIIRDSGRELADNLQILLQEGEVQALVDTDIIYPELDGDPDALLSYLLVSGYLRINGVQGEIGGDPIYTLSIPNKEINSYFRKEIIGEYNGALGGSLLRGFETALRTADSELLTATLEKYLMQSAGYFDTANESFYHGTVFGMLAIMADDYYISSNRESGEGRFDMQLEPKDKSKTGFIIEFKAAKDKTDEELRVLAGEAIKQIRDKKYDMDMRYHGISDICLIGGAFSGKHASTLAEMMD